MDKLAKDQMELVNNQIANDIKSLEYLRKIAGKPDKDKKYKPVLTPFKSKYLTNRIKK